jgi:hypothetical protein
MDITQLAQGYAQQLAGLPKDQQQMAIQAIQAQSPELAQLVQQLLSAKDAQGAQSGGVDVRPLPEQRGPRRLGASV